MVSCVFESDEQIHKSDLLWKQANGNNIDGESNPRLENFSIFFSTNKKCDESRKKQCYISFLE